jgi:hypothetical protein
MARLPLIAHRTAERDGLLTQVKRLNLATRDEPTVRRLKMTAVGQAIVVLPRAPLAGWDCKFSSGRILA